MAKPQLSAETLRSGRREVPGATDLYTAGDGSALTQHLRERERSWEQEEEPAFFERAVQRLTELLISDGTSSAREALSPSGEAAAIAKALATRCLHELAPVPVCKASVDALLAALTTALYASEPSAPMQRWWIRVLLKTLSTFKGFAISFRFDPFRLISLIQRLQFDDKHRWSGGKLLEERFEAVIKLASSCKWYFPDSAFCELFAHLDPIAAELEPFDEAFMWRVGMLALLLPPNGSHKSACRSQLLHLFGDANQLSRSVALQGESLKLLSRLAKHDISNELALDSLLNDIVHLSMNTLRVPLAPTSSMSSSKRQSSAYVPVTMLSLSKHDSQSLDCSAAKLVAHALTNEEEHVSTIEHALDILSNFAHPSSEGSWTNGLGRFIKHFSLQLVKRLEAERLDGCYHGSCSLSIETVNRIVKKLSHVIKHAHHSRSAEMRSNVSSSATMCSYLAPATVISTVFHTFERALSECESSQQLKSTIKLLEGCIRPAMLAEHSGIALDLADGQPSPSEFLTAAMQQLLERGLDPSDADKTAATLRFALSVISNERLCDDPNSTPSFLLDWDAWASDFVSRVFILCDTGDESGTESSSQKRNSILTDEATSLLHRLLHILLSVCTEITVEDIALRVSRYLLSVSGSLHAEASSLLLPLLSRAPHLMDANFATPLLKRLCSKELRQGQAAEQELSWSLCLLDMILSSGCLPGYATSALSELRRRREELEKHPLKQVESSLVHLGHSTLYGLIADRQTNQFVCSARWVSPQQGVTSKNTWETCIESDTAIHALRDAVAVMDESLSAVEAHATKSDNNHMSTEEIRVHLAVVLGIVRGFSLLFFAGNVSGKAASIAAQVPGKISRILPAFRARLTKCEDSSLLEHTVAICNALCMPASSAFDKHLSQWSRLSGAMKERRIAAWTFSFPDPEGISMPSWLKLERSIILHNHVHSKRIRFDKTNSIAYPSRPLRSSFDEPFSALQLLAVSPYSSVRDDAVNGIVSITREYFALNWDLLLSFSKPLAEDVDEESIKGAAGIMVGIDAFRYCEGAPETISSVLMRILRAQHHATAEKQYSIRSIMNHILSTLAVPYKTSLEELANVCEETLSQSGVHWRFALFAEAVRFMLRVSVCLNPSDTFLCTLLRSYGTTLSMGDTLHRKLALRACSFVCKRMLKESTVLDSDPVGEVIAPQGLMQAICDNHAQSGEEKKKDEGDGIVLKACAFVAKQRSALKSKYSLMSAVSSVEALHVRAVRFIASCAKSDKWFELLSGELEKRFDETMDTTTLKACYEILAGVISSNNAQLSSGVLQRIKTLTLYFIDLARSDFEKEVMEIMCFISQQAQKGNLCDEVAGEIANGISFDSTRSSSVMSRRLNACVGLISGACCLKDRSELEVISKLHDVLGDGAFYTHNAKNVRDKAAACVSLLVATQTGHRAALDGLKDQLSTVGCAALKTVVDMEAEATHRKAETSMSVLHEEMSYGDGHHLHEQLVDILPGVLRQLMSSSDEISTAAKSLLGIAREEMLALRTIEKLFGTLEQSASNEGYWVCRGAAVTIATAVACRHAFILPTYLYKRTGNIILKRVKADERAEVRTASSDCLPPLLRGCGEKLLLPSVIDDGITGVQRSSSSSLHGSVLLLCACVYSQPFGRPEWMPSVLTTLASVGDKHPGQVRDACRNAMKSWQRSHADSMREIKQSFTEAQWDAVERALSIAPSYIV